MWSIHKEPQNTFLVLEGRDLPEVFEEETSDRMNQKESIRMCKDTHKLQEKHKQHSDYIVIECVNAWLDGRFTKYSKGWRGVNCEKCLEKKPK